MTLADKSETKSGTEHLASQFAAIVGAAHVLSEEMERALYSQDVVQWEAPLVELVVRPASADELAGAVRRAGELGLKLAPRGGGLSYSRGYVPEGGGTVLLDLGRLNRIEEVNEDDRYVTLGSGCTWKEVADTLKPLGLRTVMAGPISGNFSTVGGAASQNVPGSMDSILGLEVVLADGRIIRTGSSAMRRATSPFYRNYGPDLTGLFLGDAGAFGVKTKLTLRIERIPEGVGFASFAFGSLADMATAIVDVARLGLTVKCFGMDPLKNRTVTKVDLSEGVAMLRDVATGSGTVLRGLKDAAKLVAVGRDALDDI
ncbi:MAG TPA: FAD-binding oxidoreductase, partial [Alphaproteobacteria bacterium]|nr:FAD-binding oxidoreductase [Alphaproteobacteria bacterium]